MNREDAANVFRGGHSGHSASTTSIKASSAS